MSWHSTDSQDALPSRRRREANPLRKFFLKLEDVAAEEGAKPTDYLAALGQGHSVVVVYAPDQQERERAHALLRAAQSYQMSYVGRWTIERLPS